MTFLAAMLALFAQAPETPLPPCSAANSVAVTIADIHRQPDHYLDRCVSVTGLFAGVRLYSSRDGIYRVGRYGPDGNPTTADLSHRIGIDHQEMRNLQLARPAKASVTGRVDSCQRRYDRVIAAGGIPFLGGYCHYESGPTIVVHQYRLEEGRFERLTGEAARRSFGNIGPIPADWRHRPALEAMASDFLAALRSGDRARMAELHDVRPDTSHEHDRAVLAMLLDDSASPFAQLRRRDAPQTAIFATTRNGAAPGGADDGVSGVLCFCRTDDCTDRWPIAALDADNAPDRPYACTQVEPRDWTARGAGLNTPLSRGGFLAEPERTAYRP